MNYYADSSFLVFCYVTDANTPRASFYLFGINAPLVFTALHALEVGNAFQLGIFRGLLTPGDATAARAHMELDLRSGRLVRRSVNWPLALRFAALFSERHASALGTRSLDILHVACARSLRALEFASFDARQRRLAGAIGLKIAP